jgi:hypothetical protein
MFRFNKLISLTSKSKSPFNLSIKNFHINTNFNNNINNNNNSHKILNFANKNFFKKTNYLQAAKKDYYST